VRVRVNETLSPSEGEPLIIRFGKVGRFIMQVSGIRYQVSAINGSV
jgi:hypothetical protein